MNATKAALAFSFVLVMIILSLGLVGDGIISQHSVTYAENIILIVFGMVLSAVMFNRQSAQPPNELKIFLIGSGVLASGITYYLIIYSVWLAADQHKKLELLGFLITYAPVLTWLGMVICLAGYMMLTAHLWRAVHGKDWVWWMPFSTSLVFISLVAIIEIHGHGWPFNLN